MYQTVCIILSAADRAALDANDHNPLFNHVQRADIVLHLAERLPVKEVASRAGVSRPSVWRWQQRFGGEGLGALLRNKTENPASPPLGASVAAYVLVLTCSEPPGTITHWTGRAAARIIGISQRLVQRIGEAHHLQPHRLRTFKISTEPAFAERVEDIAGLYMNPLAHTLVLSIDEKSQIQTFDRTRPRLPLKPGKCVTVTHDYKSNSATTLFAALNILHGVVIGCCMARYHHQDFIRLLNVVEKAVPADKFIHAIVDNYAAHRHPKVLGWLADKPRWTFHLTPPRHPGLTPSRGSFPRSAAGQSAATCSSPLAT